MLHHYNIPWFFELLPSKIKRPKMNTLLVFYSLDLSVLVYDVVGHVQGRGVRGFGGDLGHLVHG